MVIKKDNSDENAKYLVFTYTSEHNHELMSLKENFRDTVNGKRKVMEVLAPHMFESDKIDKLEPV